VTCSHCGVALIASGLWKSWTAEQRIASGGKERIGEYCAACYHRDRRGGVARKTWKLEHLIEEAEFLFEGGTAPAQVAQRLGIKHTSLCGAYDRARKKGLTTRRLAYPSTRRNK
jgi:hypothetical protein